MLSADTSLYLLKASVALAVLHPLYRALLKRETFHTLNRLFLLMVLALSLTLPLVNFTSASPTPLSEAFADVEDSLAATVNIAEAGYAQPAEAAEPSSAAHIAYATISWIYMAVTAVLLIHYLISVLAFFRIARRGEAASIASLPAWVRLRVVKRIPSSCSFINRIVLNASPDSDEGRMLLQHELVHLQRLHSADRVLSEVAARLLWFVPFAWMLRNDLRDVHEFEVDAIVAAENDRSRYGRLIVDEANIPSHTAFAAVNSFGGSSVKARLSMLCTAPSTRRSMLKATYLLPLMIVVTMLFAKPAMVAQVATSVRSAAAPVDVHHIHGAECTYQEFLNLKCPYSIRTSADLTDLTLLIMLNSDKQTVRINRSDTYLYDPASGDKYMCRNIKGYGDEVNIKVHDYPGAVIGFDLVFPPLKRDVKKVMLISGNIVHGKKAFPVKDITKKKHRVIL